MDALSAVGLHSALHFAKTLPRLQAEKEATGNQPPINRRKQKKMDIEPTKHLNGRMWQPGQSGNPNGRPVGSRTVFSQAFLKDLAEVWSDDGWEAMVKTAKTNPTVFFATCARLIGPEVKLTIEQQLPGNLSPADWNLMMQILDAVKSAIPDAANRPAGEVLEFVLGALRNCPEKAILRTVPLSRARKHGHLPNHSGDIANQIPGGRINHA